jgi:hypothetical protein
MNRQLRVANGSCTVAGVFNNVYSTCYAKFYTDKTRDTRPFGPTSDPKKYGYPLSFGVAVLFVCNLWSWWMWCLHRYTFDDNGQGVHTLGFIWDGFYSNDGYVVDVPVDANFSARIDDLIVCATNQLQCSTFIHDNTDSTYFDIL